MITRQITLIAFRIVILMEGKKWAVIIEAQDKEEALNEDHLGLQVVKKFGYKPYSVVNIRRLEAGKAL